MASCDRIRGCLRICSCVPLALGEHEHFLWPQPRPPACHSTRPLRAFIPPYRAPRAFLHAVMCVVVHLLPLIQSTCPPSPPHPPVLPLPLPAHSPGLLPGVCHSHSRCGKCWATQHFHPASFVPPLHALPCCSARPPARLPARLPVLLPLPLMLHLAAQPRSHWCLWHGRGVRQARPGGALHAAPVRQY